MESRRVAERRGAACREARPQRRIAVLLDRPVTLAGRHPDSDIFLDDITVSRRHAEFRSETGEFDIGSLNGTNVNREPVDSVVLANGIVNLSNPRAIFAGSPPPSLGRV